MRPTGLAKPDMSSSNCYMQPIQDGVKGNYKRRPGASCNRYSKGRICIIVVSFVVLLHLLVKYNRRVWRTRHLYDGPLPRIWSEERRSHHTGFCFNFEPNFAALEILSQHRLGVLVIMFTSSSTYETRAKHMYQHYGKQLGHFNMSLVAVSDGPVQTSSALPTLSDPSSGSSKTDYQNRVAQFMSVIVLPCLPRFQFLLLLDDDALLHPGNFHKELHSNPAYAKSPPNGRLLSGDGRSVCNVLCGGAGMLFSYELLKDIEKHSKIFFQRYGAVYSKYVDVRLSRFVLEVLRLRPVHNSKFLNDPPLNITKESLSETVTVHHVFQHKPGTLHLRSKLPNLKLFNEIAQYML